MEQQQINELEGFNRRLGQGIMHTLHYKRKMKELQRTYDEEMEDVKEIEEGRS